MPRPRDITMQRPDILFVGINPGARSGKLGHHFAGPGNPFWKLMHAAGLTPIVLRPDEDRRLVEFGYALTNLVARSTKSAAELSRTELARGRRRLLAKVRAMRPDVVCLVGITLYPVLFGRKGVPGRAPDTLAGARVFVVPNPSGLNASFPSFASKLTWFRKLATFAGKPS